MDAIARGHAPCPRCMAVYRTEGQLGAHLMGEHHQSQYQAEKEAHAAVTGIRRDQAGRCEGCRRPEGEPHMPSCPMLKRAARQGYAPERPSPPVVAAPVPAPTPPVTFLPIRPVDRPAAGEWGNGPRRKNLPATQPPSAAPTPPAPQEAPMADLSTPVPCQSCSKPFVRKHGRSRLCADCKAKPKGDGKKKPAGEKKPAAPATPRGKGKARRATTRHAAKKKNGRSDLASKLTEAKIKVTTLREELARAEVKVELLEELVEA